MAEAIGEQCVDFARHGLEAGFTQVAGLAALPCGVDLSPDLIVQAGDFQFDGLEVASPDLNPDLGIAYVGHTRSIVLEPGIEDQGLDNSLICIRGNHLQGGTSLCRLRPASEGHEPDEGCLPRHIAAVLAVLLARFTTTQDRCWFCVWEEYVQRNI